MPIKFGHGKDAKNFLLWGVMRDLPEFQEAMARAEKMREKDWMILSPPAFLYDLYTNERSCNQTFWQAVQTVFDKEHFAKDARNWRTRDFAVRLFCINPLK